jgi:hypothetical protein
MYIGFSIVARLAADNQIVAALLERLNDGE